MIKLDIILSLLLISIGVRAELRRDDKVTMYLNAVRNIKSVQKYLVISLLLKKDEKWIQVLVYT